MPTQASKSSAKIRHVVSYDSRNGEDEYEMTRFFELDHTPSNLECVRLLIDEFVCDDDEKKEALQEYVEEGYFTILCGCRTVSNVRVNIA
jgi:hypothetical protein